MPSITSQLDKMIETINKTRKDAYKVDHKRMIEPAIRVRKVMQKLRKQAKKIRMDIQEMRRQKEKGKENT